MSEPQQSTFSLEVRGANPSSPAALPGPRPLRIGRNMARLTVVDSVYFEQADGQSMAQPSSFTRSVQSEEQPYLRQIMVSDDWQQLDKGWVVAAAMLVITHDKSSHSNDPLYICFSGAGKPKWSQPDIEIPRGESARFKPASLSSIWLRASSGRARVILLLLPDKAPD